MLEGSRLVRTILPSEKGLGRLGADGSRAREHLAQELGQHALRQASILDRIHKEARHVTSTGLTAASSIHQSRMNGINHVFWILTSTRHKLTCKNA